MADVARLRDTRGGHCCCVGIESEIRVISFDRWGSGREMNAAAALALDCAALR